MSQPLLGDQDATHQDEADQDEAAALRLRLSGAAPDERLRILRETMRGQASHVLARPVEDDSNFMELGITSLQALQLNRSLMDLTGMEIPLVTIIEHPTPARLADFVDTALGTAGTSAD